MSAHSTGTFSAVVIATAFAATTSGDVQTDVTSDSVMLAKQVYEMRSNKVSSGMPVMYYNHASEVIETTREKNSPIEIKSIKMQLRYQAIERSFRKNCVGFPVEKENYLQLLSNAVCRLPFIDNVSEYNRDDDTIDTILKLSNGLKLSISQFLDEDAESPAVFSIHRGSILLVSDELPMSEIVNTIVSVIEKSERINHV